MPQNPPLSHLAGYLKFEQEIFVSGTKYDFQHVKLMCFYIKCNRHSHHRRCCSSILRIRIVHVWVLPVTLL